MKRAALLASAILALGTRLGAGEMNWPEFRGPRGDGTSGATGLALRWGESRNIAWQVPIHGRAWSSPVIWGSEVWLTTATEDGHELFAICVDRETGKVKHDVKLFDVAKPQYCIPFNTYASPTPAIEAGRVYVTFGAAGTACLDSKTAQPVWTRRDLQCNHFRGPGSSPILYRNLLILNFDGSDFQFVVGLDTATGRTVWKRDRSVDFRDLGPDGKPEMAGDYRKAFATCQVAVMGGRALLLSQGSKAFYAYEPLTGLECWRVEDRSCYSGCTRPVIGHGMVFVPTGFPNGEIMAIRPGKPGQVLDVKTGVPAPVRESGAQPSPQLQLVWESKPHAPKKPSLLLLDDLLYAVDDNGTATCLQALNGEVLWSQPIGGHYSASPLAAANRIYFFSEEGKTSVIGAGREFTKLAENQLGDGFMASPAVSGNALFLRSRTKLYRIEDRSMAPSQRAP